MTMFDNQALKQRIADIIMANKNLYNPKGEDGKLVGVYVGFPKNKNNIYSVDTPYLAVTNAQRFITKVTQMGGIVNNGYTSKMYDVNYNLIIIDKQEDGQTVEKSLDILIKKLGDTLDGNFTLRKDDGTDDKVKASLADTFSMLSANQKLNNGTDGFEVNLHCQVITSV